MSEQIRELNEKSFVDSHLHIETEKWSIKDIESECNRRIEMANEYISNPGRWYKGIEKEGIELKIFYEKIKKWISTLPADTKFTHRKESGSNWTWTIEEKDPKRNMLSTKEIAKTREKSDKGIVHVINELYNRQQSKNITGPFSEKDWFHPSETIGRVQFPCSSCRNFQKSNVWCSENCKWYNMPQFSKK